MSEDTMPADWVMIEAAKRAGWGQRRPDILRESYFGSFKALCDALIAPPIEPPVDPDVDAVKRIIETWTCCKFNWGNAYNTQALTRAVAQYKLERAK